MTPQTIGQLLWATRQRSGHLLQQAAAKLAIEPGRLNRFESDQEPIPPELLQQIATLISADPEALLRHCAQLAQPAAAKPTVSIIFPMTTSSDFLWLLNLVCLRTCRATAPDAEILVLANNSPPSSFVDDLKQQCELLNIRYHHEDGVFNMARYYNLGTRMTTGEYVVYGSADLIFYAGWCDRLLEAYRTRPNYFSLSPWTFHTATGGLGYKQNQEHQDEVVTTHWVATGAPMMRRDLGYEYDEHFADWEMDCDYHNWAKERGLPLGLVMNSRVDHLISAVRGRVDLATNYGDAEYQNKASDYLKKKWNLP